MTGSEKLLRGINKDNKQKEIKSSTFLMMELRNILCMTCTTHTYARLCSYLNAKCILGRNFPIIKFDSKLVEFQN